VTPPISPESSKRRRHDDRDEEKRLNGCATCGLHGVVESRLEPIEENFPAVMTWMNQEKGTRSALRWLFGLSFSLFCGGMLTIALTIKGDMDKSHDNLRQEIFVNRENIKSEFTARQQAFEQSIRDQSSTSSSQIKTMVDIVGEIKLQVGIMVEMDKVNQKRDEDDRLENKRVIQELRDQMGSAKSTVRRQPGG